MDLSRITDIWASGGWVLLPLYTLAVLLYAQAYGLLASTRRAKLDRGQEERWWEWVATPEKAPGRVGEILRYTSADGRSAGEVRARFGEVRATLLDRLDGRSRFLSTLVASAPLLGLLGTVMGMLRTFFGIAAGGSAETAAVVASGISEALVTTQAGLMTALPGLFVAMWVRRERHVLEHGLSRLECLATGHAELTSESRA